MKRFIIVLLALLLASWGEAASFYWKTTKSALDAISGKTTGDRGIVIDSSGVFSIWYYDGSAWVQSSLTGGLKSITKADAYTLGTDDPQEAWGTLVYVTATSTQTLPAVVPGMSVCYVAIGAVTVTVDPNASDGIRLNGGTRDTDGDAIVSSGTAGNKICLHGDSADGWTTWGREGTWTAQ